MLQEMQAGAEACGRQGSKGRAHARITKAEEGVSRAGSERGRSAMPFICFSRSRVWGLVEKVRLPGVGCDNGGGVAGIEVEGQTCNSGGGWERRDSDDQIRHTKRDRERG